MFLRFGVVPENIVNILLFLLKLPFFEKHFGHTYRLARNVITILGRKMPVRGHITNRIFDKLSLNRLRMGASPLQEKEVEEILLELVGGLENLSPIRLGIPRQGSAGCQSK